MPTLMAAQCTHGLARGRLRVRLAPTADCYPCRCPSQGRRTATYGAAEPLQLPTLSCATVDPMRGKSTHLAVVPAYNEAATVGARRRARIHAQGARVRRRRHRRRLDRRDRASSPSGRARRCCACRSTSASAAPSRPASSTRSSTATTTWSRSTATASTTRASSRSSSAAMDADPTSTWSAARASSTDDELPRADQPAHRHPHLRVPAVAASSRQRVTDPTSGFRLYNRRAIELFARDYPHDYPEVEAVLMLHHHRLRMREVPGADVRARRRRRRRSARASRPTTWSRCCSPCSSACCAGAPCPSPGEPRAGRRGARDLMDTPDPDRRHHRRRGPAAGRRARARAPARGCSSATRCCGCSAALVLLGAGDLARRAGRGSRDRSAIAYPPNALFFVALRLRPAAAAALLGRGVAAERPVEGPRAAARAARGARCAAPSRPMTAATTSDDEADAELARRAAASAPQGSPEPLACSAAIPRPLGAAARRRRAAHASPGRSRTAPFQGPDEPAHFDYAQYLAETGHRPAVTGGTASRTRRRSATALDLPEPRPARGRSPTRARRGRSSRSSGCRPCWTSRHDGPAATAAGPTRSPRTRRCTTPTRRSRTGSARSAPSGTGSSSCAWRAACCSWSTVLCTWLAAAEVFAGTWPRAARDAAPSRCCPQMTFHQRHGQRRQPAHRGVGGVRVRGAAARAPRAEPRARRSRCARWPPRRRSRTGAGRRSSSR